MSAPTTPDEAIALMRAIRAAMSTREGRAVVREIVGALKLAAEEAVEADPVAADVDACLSRARKADRARAAAAVRGRR